MAAISPENLEGEIRSTVNAVSSVASREVLRRTVLELMGSEFDEEFASVASVEMGVGKTLNYPEAFTPGFGAEDVTQYDEQDSLAVLVVDEILHRAVTDAIAHIRDSDVLDRILNDAIAATLAEQLAANPADIVAGIESDVLRTRRKA